LLTEPYLKLAGPSKTTNFTMMAGAAGYVSLTDAEGYIACVYEHSPAPSHITGGTSSISGVHIHLPTYYKITEVDRVLEGGQFVNQHPENQWRRLTPTLNMDLDPDNGWQMRRAVLVLEKYLLPSLQDVTRFRVELDTDIVVEDVQQHSKFPPPQEIVRYLEDIAEYAREIAKRHVDNRLATELNDKEYEQNEERKIRVSINYGFT